MTTAPTAATSSAAVARAARPGRARVRRSPATVEGPAPRRRATAATARPPEGAVGTSWRTWAAGSRPARQAGTTTDTASRALTRMAATSSDPRSKVDPPPPTMSSTSPRPGAASEPSSQPITTPTIPITMCSARVATRELPGPEPDRPQEGERPTAGDEAGRGGAGDDEARRHQQEGTEPADDGAEHVAHHEDVAAGVGPHVGAADALRIGLLEPRRDGGRGARVVEAQGGDGHVVRAGESSTSASGPKTRSGSQVGQKQSLSSTAPPTTSSSWGPCVW